MGKWVVDFDHSQCVAMRSYGSESSPLTLFLKAPALGNVVQVGVIRPGRAGRYADQLDAKIVIDGRSTIPASMIAFTSPETKRRQFRTNLPREQFELVRTARTVSIQAGRELDETFALTQMGPLLKVLGECVADLRKVWNVPLGDISSATLRARAAGDLKGLIRAEDYPEIALRKLAGGTVLFVVLIDETGKVADCTVAETSGIAALDSQSCAIITERARFKPAIGLDGKPARDAYQQRVTWMVR
jgi:TonB family protein